MKTYIEKLKDPRWQKKRLEIMKRDDFACQRCGDTSKTQNVHHLVYFTNRAPWDYNDIELITLCENCHKHEESNIKQATKHLVYNVKTSGMLSDDIEDLAAYHKKRRM